MTETLPDALVRLARFLAEWQKPYALIGALAVIAHTAVRETEDIDVLISATSDDSQALLALARRHGYSWDAKEMEALLPGGLVFLKNEAEGHVPVDLLFVEKPFEDEILRRATRLDLGPCRFPVATVEDLLLLKLVANRTQDLEDCIAIKDAHGATLDRDYVLRKAAELGIRERVERFLA